MDAYNNGRKSTVTSMDPKFYEVDSTPKTTVIRFSDAADSLTMAHYQIPQKIAFLVDKGFSNFIVDLSQANLVDSSTIGFISKLIQMGNMVSIVCQKESAAYHLFSQYGLFDLLDRYKTLGEAINTPRSPSV